MNKIIHKLRILQIIHFFFESTKSSQFKTDNESFSITNCSNNLIFQNQLSTVNKFFFLSEAIKFMASKYCRSKAEPIGSVPKYDSANRNRFLE